MASPRSPLALAALVCSAVKGCAPVTTRALPAADADVDAAHVEDSQGRHWVVRAPRTAAAGATMDAESRLVEGLSGWVSFSVPRTAGRARLPDGGSAHVHPAPAGTPLDAARLEASPALAASLGRTLAVVHDLPTRLVADVDMPVYEAEEYRRRRMAEVDRAAATGHVPSALLTRWEQAIEHAGAWRFAPCLVHGELDGGNVLVEGNEVSGIVDWAQARVADPADDFAWLANAVPQGTFDTVVAAYAARRRNGPDGDLVGRARLAGELLLARWLLHGTKAGDATVVQDAVAMLEDLARTVVDDPLFEDARAGRHAAGGPAGAAGADPGADDDTDTDTDTGMDTDTGDATVAVGPDGDPDPEPDDTADDDTADTADTADSTDSTEVMGAVGSDQRHRVPPHGVPPTERG